MLILGTAGHIDHGKTSLVRLLTGRNLDTLPEEKERGITIALGFSPLDLPDGRRAALVDVPGHERLVRTMIAGATGVDAVLLVVSAVDGMMPQTREHLAILELLGVENGVVVLTMIDRVDDEMVELARADVEDGVAGTFLQHAPVVATSAVDGRGREELLELLQGLKRRPRSESGPFRLPVDRTFSKPGFGSVSTGSVASGVLDPERPVHLLPGGMRGRVRGVQVHGADADLAQAGQRVALNLASVSVEDVSRGTVISQGDVPCPQMIDVEVRMLESIGELPDPMGVRVLLGTAEVLGKLYRAGVEGPWLPGARSMAQLRLDEPLPCLPNDRFILRRVSPVETLGGGAILDPWAPKLRTRDRMACESQLVRLRDGDPMVFVERAGDDGLALDDWRKRTTKSPPEALAGRLYAPGTLRRWEGKILEGLASFHEASPLALGVHRRSLHSSHLPHLSDAVFDALIDRLSASQVVLEGPLVRVKSYERTLTDAQHTLRGELAAYVADAGPAGVSPKTLHDRFPEPEVAALMAWLTQDDVVHSVPSIGWVDRGVTNTLLGDVRNWFNGHDQLTPGEFKTLSGLTRKTAIPWLEWMDRERYTAFAESGRRTRGSQL